MHPNFRSALATFFENPYSKGWRLTSFDQWHLGRDINISDIKQRPGYFIAMSMRHGMKTKETPTEDSKESKINGLNINCIEENVWLSTNGSP